jgi:hypothetical protein
MGWKGVTIMDQRVRFIAEHLNEYICGISLRRGEQNWQRSLTVLPVLLNC